MRGLPEKENNPIYEDAFNAACIQYVAVAMRDTISKLSKFRDEENDDYTIDCTSQNHGRVIDTVRGSFKNQSSSFELYVSEKTSNISFKLMNEKRVGISYGDETSISVGRYYLYRQFQGREMIGINDKFEPELEEAVALRNSDRPIVDFLDGRVDSFNKAMEDFGKEDLKIGSVSKFVEGFAEFLGANKFKSKAVENLINNTQNKDQF